MLTTKLPKYLDSFVGDKIKSVVLINGRWGCGKTFTVNRFLEKREIPSVYLSLFGINNSDEVVIRLSEYLDNSYITNINGHYGFVQLSSPKIEFNGNLIVFDDLERIGKKFGFPLLYGLINSLKMLGFKIVCIINSLELSGQSEFEHFREKIVDDTINLQADSNLFQTVTNLAKFSNEFGQTVLKDANDNWRTIIRAANRFQDISNKISERDDAESIRINMNISDEDFFRSCCLADMCFFSNDNKKRKINNDFIRFQYEEYIKNYGICPANSLYEIFYVKKESRLLLQIVDELLSLFTTGDYDHFINNYSMKSHPAIDASSILEKQPFYLSDNKRRQYKASFMKKLNLFSFSSSYYKQKLNDFLTVFLESLSKKERRMICEKIVNDISTEDARNFVEELLYGYIGDPEDAASFKRDLLTMFEKKKNLESDKEITELLKKKDYSKLTSYLYLRRYSIGQEKDFLLKKLGENNFYLPNLSREVDYYSWGFCHEVARFVSESDEYRKQFIEILEEQCRNHPNSKSLKERCNALVKYNFNMSGNYFS